MNTITKPTRLKVPRTFREDLGDVAVVIEYGLIYRYIAEFDKLQQRVNEANDGAKGINMSFVMSMPFKKRETPHGKLIWIHIQHYIDSDVLEIMDYKVFDPSTGEAAPQELVNDIVMGSANGTVELDAQTLKLSDMKDVIENYMKEARNPPREN